MFKNNFPSIPTKRKSRGTPSKALKPEPMDFRESANWRIFRIMAEFVDGFSFLADLHREVTFFGSGRCSAQSQSYKQAEELAYKLGKDRFTIITGGGAGIMEAANKGAKRSGTDSVGINIQLPYEQRINEYVTKGIGFNFFFTRKVMLSISAQAYVVFPGGFGTIDEFSELITLIQTEKIAKVPVVLINKKFWTPFLNWIDKTMLQELQTISPTDTKIYTLVDTVAEAYKIISQTKEKKFFN